MKRRGGGDPHPVPVACRDARCATLMGEDARAMTTRDLWRLILIATVICVVMLFVPLVGAIVERLREAPFPP